MSKLINKAKVRAFALACASKRAHKFTRVGADFYLQAEVALKAWIMSRVNSAPSKGQTL